MFSAGQEIANKYRLTRRLGGSDGAPVWLATSRERPQPVVLKMRPLATATAADTAIAWNMIDHPGIVRAVERLTAGAHELQVFEFLAQGELGAFRGSPCARWLPLATQVAAALAYLHSQRLVHGDVKTTNVLVDSAGNALLADLETVRPVGAECSAADGYSPYTASPQQQSGAAVQVGDDIYSFGAMLYELLCAEPPGYVRSPQSVPPTSGAGNELAPVHPAPAELVELVQRCLAVRVEARPNSMDEVERELRALDANAALVPASTPLLTPPTAAAAALRPAWQRSQPTEPTDVQKVRRQAFRQGVLLAAGLALLAVAVMLFVIPSRRAEPGLAVPLPTPLPSAAAEQQAVDLKTLADAKTDAENRREQLAPRIAALQAADAASWNAAAMSIANTKLAEAEKLIEQREYASASRLLEALAVTVTDLEAGRNPALNAALQRGQTALSQLDSRAAGAAFAQALKISASNAAAQRGQRRAASLDAVQANMQRAAALEQSGRLAEAAAAYRHVLSVDADTTAAQAGVARLQSRLAADQFGQTLARGFAALSAGRTAEAREALNLARQLRPNDVEVTRALEQLAAAETATQLTTALTAARAAERDEHWAEAVSKYQQALGLDATLVAARQALINAQARTQLERELRSLISQPERAFSAAVHEAGLASLQRAQAVANPGPVLTRQIGDVAALLQKADTPVTVTLRSDGLSNVTVYKVGEQGSFAERSLQLKPGRYVVAATRVGYRDVRRELLVTPDRELAPLLVQCTEPL